MKKRLVIKRKNKNILSIENYPMVSVEWLDIESNSSWQNLKELEKAKLPVCITKGHLFSQKKELLEYLGITLKMIMMKLLKLETLQ